MPTRLILTTVLLLTLTGAAQALAQSLTAFSYQGRLTEAGLPADSMYDMQFKLFDTATVNTGTQQGPTVTNSTVQVTNGVFVAQLDFGAGVFDGAARFLEISVRPAGSPGPYTVLGPRQLIAATPYSMRSQSAAWADNTAQLGGQPASGFIQNTTSQQTTTNFNISGNGTAGGTLTGGVVNAATQYNFGGMRMLVANGPYNDGGNIMAMSNTFLGEGAGLNTTPSALLFGQEGKFNTFVGAEAGRSNTTGAGNSFFGQAAGRTNTTGNVNSFFGLSAGFSNTTGSSNSFFGKLAGAANTTGSSNTMLGDNADAGANNLTNATAIGAKAQVDQSNSLVLGSINGVNGATATVNVGIGTTTPADRLHVNGIIRVDTLGATGLTDVCRNILNQLSTCSSSLRYKERISDYGSGLELIQRLRPITFSWKQGGARDVGFAAEEVAEVEPLLVTHNDQGQVEGVKYDRITAALVNAVKQQQAQIEVLRKAVCQMNPKAEICK